MSSGFRRRLGVSAGRRGCERPAVALRSDWIKRPRRVAFAAALAVLLAAPSAAGASVIGPSNVFSAPGVAVDASGTAYIAWRGPESAAGSLQFCRLPRGAGACDSRHAIAAPGDTVSRAFVVVGGTRVVVVQFRYGAGVPGSKAVYAFTSNDRGATFGAGQVVGTEPFFEAVVGPGDTLSGVTNAETPGEAFQNVPLDGSSGSATVHAQLSADHPYNGTVGLIDATTPLAIFTNGSAAAQFRRYDGSGSLNDVTNWTAAVDLGVMSYPKLAGGPSGLFLLATTDANPYTLFARKWNGTTFGAPVAVAGGASPPTLHVFQDAGGRLHAVFVRGDVNGLHLIHAVSNDGVTWRSGTVVTQTAADGGIADTRVATAPDHIGVTVWNAGAREIRVAAVGPGPPRDAAPTPTPILKRKPSMTASGKAKRAGPNVRIAISGKLRLPAGISKAAGCNGTMKISIARAKKRIASKTVRIRPTCAFGLTTKLKRNKVKRAKKLAVSFRFSGNTLLTPTKKTGSIKVK